MMMRRQVELRREEARAVHACVLPIPLSHFKREVLIVWTFDLVWFDCRKCDALEAKLAEMRASVQSMSAGPREGSGSQVGDMRLAVDVSVCSVCLGRTHGSLSRTRRRRWASRTSCAGPRRSGDGDSCPY